MQIGAVRLACLARLADSDRLTALGLTADKFFPFNQVPARTKPPYLLHATRGDVEGIYLDTGDADTTPGKGDVVAEHTVQFDPITWTDADKEEAMSAIYEALCTVPMDYVAIGDGAHELFKLRSPWGQNWYQNQPGHADFEGDIWQRASAVFAVKETREVPK